MFDPCAVGRETDMTQNACTRQVCLSNIVSHQWNDAKQLRTQQMRQFALQPVGVSNVRSVQRSSLLLILENSSKES